jgi:hypothetical protein
MGSGFRPADAKPSPYYEDVHVKTSVRLLALPLLLAGVIGCKGSDNTLPGATGSVSASINGTSWTSSMIVQGSYTGNALFFGGMDGNQTQIFVTVPSITVGGTYDIGAGRPGAGVVTIAGQSWSSNVVGGSGTVIVNTLTSTHAAGTFTFTGIAAVGTSAKTVTNGTFDVTF